MVLGNRPACAGFIRLSAAETAAFLRAGRAPPGLARTGAWWTGGRVL